MWFYAPLRGECHKKNARRQPRFSLRQEKWVSLATIDDLQMRRAEFVARRRVLKGELTRLAADIVASDRVARMVDPDYRPETAPRGRPPKAEGTKHSFASGEMVRAALNALRSLNRPASSGECVRAMLSTLGASIDDGVLVTLTNRVSALLAQKAEGGQVLRAGHGTDRQVFRAIAQ